MGSFTWRMKYQRGYWSESGLDFNHKGEIGLNDVIKITNALRLHSLDDICTLVNKWEIIDTLSDVLVTLSRLERYEDCILIDKKLKEINESL